MPRRPSNSKPAPIRSATSTRISLLSPWHLDIPLPQHLDAKPSTCPESSSHVGTYSSSLHRCGLLIVAPARLLSQTSKEAFPSHRQHEHSPHSARFKLAWPKQGQQSMRHALHPSCPLTWVLLRALLGRRYLAPAVVVCQSVHGIVDCMHVIVPGTDVDGCTVMTYGGR